MSGKSDYEQLKGDAITGVIRDGEPEMDHYRKLREIYGPKRMRSGWKKRPK